MLGFVSRRKQGHACLSLIIPSPPIPARPQPRIEATLHLLGQEFCTSTNSNHRKGGLIALAAAAIGLMASIQPYLDLLLPPILHCFDDPESRVRYYACESLYNVAKVARQDVLLHFNTVFEGLCKLFADGDPDVKNGANLLDRLVKDIVTESDIFDVEKFIPILKVHWGGFWGGGEVCVAGLTAD